MRAAFRDAVFTRDRYTCVVCGKRWSKADADPSLGRINAHHVTDRSLMPGGGHVAANGVTVCDGGEDSCHMKCEAFHISGGASWVDGLHPNDLYKKIGSSLDVATRACSALVG